MTHELKPAAFNPVSQAKFLPSAPPPDRFSSAATLRSQLHRGTTALRKRWWIFLLTFLLVGGPAVYYAATKPATFSSEATMWLATKPNLPNVGYYPEDLTRYIATQAQLIKSPIIQFRAFEKVRALFPALVGVKTNAASVNLPSDPAHLPFNLTVRTLPNTSVVELQAVGPAHEATQAFLDAVMNEYLAFQNDSRKRTSSGALSRITDQIVDVQKQIQQQENQLTLFQVSNNISYLNEHGLSAGSHLSKLDEILSNVQTEYRLLELLTPEQVSDLSAGNQNTLSETVLPGETAARAVAAAMQPSDTAYYQALQQLQLLKAMRDDFARVLRPTHSKMIKLNQEIAGLEQLLKTLQDDGEQRALAQMTNRKKALRLQIESLENEYRTWETNATAASQKLAEYDRINQDLQRSQALYDRLLGLLQTVDLNNGLDQELLVPMAPASPARPTLAKTGTMAAGLLLAFLVAVGVFLALEFLDDRFTSVSELSLLIPAEVVGQIPKTRLLPPNGVRRLIAADAQPAFAESFRSLRSFLLFMSPGQNSQPKVILVTSAIPKEGKTTVASNLARTLAMSGSRVLLVDADVRRGSVHQIFDVRLKPGLLEVLSHEVPAAQAIVATAQPGLFVLPAGESENNNSDTFLRSGVDKLLHDLAAQFSYIVIDSAPVLATDDAACLGPNTDGVFMVVRASYTSARATREALDRLRKRKVNVLGMVYNCASPSSDYYSQYSRDYYTPQGKATGPSAPGLAEDLSQDAKGKG